MLSANFVESCSIWNLPARRCQAVGLLPDIHLSNVPNLEEMLIYWLLCSFTESRSSGYLAAMIVVLPPMRVAVVGFLSALTIAGGRPSVPNRAV